MNDIMNPGSGARPVSGPVGRDPRLLIAELPMTAFQIAVIGMLFCLNALDGFDVLAVAFAAPGLTKDWGIGPGGLGLVISLGLFGSGFGSLIIAPFGDRIGRRPMIFWSLGAMAAGMLLCAAEERPATSVLPDD